MARTPIPLVGGFYSDEPWSAEDTVNWLPVPAESDGSRTRSKLRAVPGMDLFTTIDSGPIRGWVNVNGTLYLVSNRSLYKMASDGTASKLGTVPGTGRVSMAYGLADTGYQIVVVNGSSGYIYDSGAKTFVRIVDSAYTGARCVEFINQYFMQIEPSRRYFFISSAADAANYDSTDRFSAESQPDRLVTLKALGNDVWVFGDRTTEVWSATGDGTTKFARNNGTTIDIGAASEYGVAKVDGRLAWLGHDGAIYATDGYSAKRISNGAIEAAIAGCTWSECSAFEWTGKGHKVAYFSFPDGMTWGYDFWTGAWHRRETYGWDRWRVQCSVWWSERWLIGDVSNGNVYALNWDSYDDNGEPLVSSRSSGVLHKDGDRFSVNGIELFFDTGNAKYTEDEWLACEDGSWLQTEAEEYILVSLGSEAESTVQLCYSDDGGRNWSNLRFADLGSVGEYNKRVSFKRFGQTRQRIFKVAVSSRAKRDLLGGTIDV